MPPYTKEEYHQAQIFPDASAGYIILRDQYDDLLRKLDYPNDDQIVVPASPRHLGSPIRRIKYGSVTFMLNKGLYIFQIAVSKGYSGKTEEGIGLGTTLDEVKSIWGTGELKVNESLATLWTPVRYPWTSLWIGKGSDQVQRVSAVIITDLAKNNFEFEDHYPRGILEKKKRMIIKHPVEKPLEDDT